MAQNITKFSESELELLRSIGIDDETSMVHLTRISASTGDTIFSPGDTGKVFLILLSGQIRVDLITKTDREITLYRMRETETCIITATTLLDSETYFARGIAETNITALAMVQADFEKVMAKSPAFTRFVLQDYARRVSSLVELVDRLTTKDVQADILAFLRSEMDEDGNVEISQVDLARNIGTAREVISRKLGWLGKQGVLRRERGRIVILDKTKLM